MARRSETDLARVRAKTDADIARDVASDPDWQGIPEDWYKTAEAVRPKAKRSVTIRLDGDLVEWFLSGGPGYQTRINAVLRAYVSSADRVSKTRAAVKRRVAATAKANEGWEPPSEFTPEQSRSRDLK